MFLDIEFPRGIKFHSLGGPRFSTNLNAGFGGDEQRNQNWAGSRAKYTISMTTPGHGIASRRQYIDALQNFFYLAAGRANSFRFWDARDHSLAGQRIATGDGATKNFQIIKNYVIGGNSFSRVISKPLMPPAVDYLGNALGSSLSVSPAGGTVDPATGIVSYATAPGTGIAIIVNSGDFHVAVRFDSDELPIEIEESAVSSDETIISVNGLALVEVFPPDF